MQSFENFENESLTRQLDVVPTSILSEPITIIGAGAIGSFTALTLAKMGFNDITVYDFDKIEAVNLNSQFYRFSDIGKFKVNALSDLIRDFTGTEITAKNEKYEGGNFNGIVISAVDSMAVRKRLWDSHKQFSVGTKLFVDSRMAIEFCLIYAMNPLSEKDIKSFEKTLYTDENSVQERCTNKSVMYTVSSISSQVAKVVKDFLSAERYARVIQWNIKENDCKWFWSDTAN